jgi:hypothetical protein
MPFLVTVEACVEVAEDRFTIEPGRIEMLEGPAPFDTKVAPPRADEPRERCGWSLSRPLSTSCRDGGPLRILGALVRAYH